MNSFIQINDNIVHSKAISLGPSDSDRVEQSVSVDSLNRIESYQICSYNNVSPIPSHLFMIGIDPTTGDFRSCTIGPTDGTTTGTSSLAMGIGASAMGASSVAIGLNVTANVDTAIAIGNNTSANSVNAISIGTTCSTTGASLNVGFSNSVVGESNSIVGRTHNVVGNNNNVVGTRGNVTGNDNQLFGELNTCTGNSGILMGKSLNDGGFDDTIILGQSYTATFAGEVRIPMGNSTGALIIAGGASALPAQPNRYLRITDATGTKLLIPAYTE